MLLVLQVVFSLCSVRAVEQADLSLIFSNGLCLLSNKRKAQIASSLWLDINTPVPDMQTANRSFTNKDKLNINKHDKVFFIGAYLQKGWASPGHQW